MKPDDPRSWPNMHDLLWRAQIYNPAGLTRLANWMGIRTSGKHIKTIWAKVVRTW